MPSAAALAHPTALPFRPLARHGPRPRSVLRHCWLPVLQPISARIEAAFLPTGYRLVTDNEHLMYLAPTLADAVEARQAPSPAQLRAARSAIRHAKQC